MKCIKEAKPRQTEIDRETRAQVAEIIDNIRESGDDALWGYSEQFEKSSRRSEGKGLRVTQDEIDEAYTKVGKDEIKDMAQAMISILGFAEAQKQSLQEVREFSPREGVYLGHRIIPIESCMCYIPGGNYPLYSTALMLIIPAKEAGVSRVIACSPVEKATGHINPKTLVAMDLAGADEIYAIGGAQAIAACAYGTDSIKPVDLIVGPGNQYVAEAKRQCYGQVGIDFVAGPSEVLVIADGTGNPEIVAADLLAQAEHDVNAKSILVTTDAEFAAEVENKVKQELQDLDTRDIAEVSWNDNGEIVLVDSIEAAIEYANLVAPEHLELNIDFGAEESQEHSDKVEYYLRNLVNYGSLFIGENSAEVFGDYASGPNHTLPTVKASRYTGGLWVGTFLKTVTYQRLTEAGSTSLSDVVERLAKGEGLSAHAIAAKIRK